MEMKKLSVVYKFTAKKREESDLHVGQMFLFGTQLRSSLSWNNLVLLRKRLGVPFSAAWCPCERFRSRGTHRGPVERSRLCVRKGELASERKQEKSLTREVAKSTHIPEQKEKSTAECIPLKNNTVRPKGGIRGWDWRREEQETIYTTTYETDNQCEFAVWPGDLRRELCNHLEGWDAVGGGRQVQEAEDPRIAVADSSWRMSEANRTLWSSYCKLKKKKIKQTKDPRGQH